VLSSGTWAALGLAALRPARLAAGWGAEAASLLALVGLPRGLLPCAALDVGGAVAGATWLLAAAASAAAAAAAASSGWCSRSRAALASALLALVGLPLALLVPWPDDPPGGAVGAEVPRSGMVPDLAVPPPGTGSWWGRSGTLPPWLP
jgi:hypothetical protein